MQARLMPHEPVPIAPERPALPEPPPRPAPPEPPARPQGHRAAPSGWVIQVGATEDERKAKAMLKAARSRSGRALARAAPFTERIVRDGTTLYRARFSGFDEAASANAACRTLKRSGFACFAIRS
jgi:D-alanyl-D-alanine carboxypeptidase